MIMNVAIYLQSDISSFNITEEHVSVLQGSFPHWQFHFCTSEESLLHNLQFCNLCITWKFCREWYEKAPQLKAIFTPSAGHDWIERSSSQSIPVFFGSFHGPIMAESLLGMILYFNRNFQILFSNKVNHTWNRDILSNTSRLGSQTVALIGYGNIARECARILKVFGCRVIGVKHSRYDPVLDKDTDAIVHPDNLKKILPISDHIVAILPGTNGNRNFFTRETFSAIKKGACFYNIGRGNCYSESDLIWALDEKILSGAGLDVFFEEPLPQESALWDRPDVFIMPHGSAICKDYLPMYIQQLIPDLRAFS